ncbi:S1 RNA-binding domain-containing protein [Streptomyces hundungensis]|uniref:S1 RNA-binding domain-containing protein n=1 Tax=Streptomyces hundungensis TaxID=1077946 RepID=UPI0033D43F88
MLDDGGVLPYVYRVTKYDPADRDEHGHYTGAEDTVSDHGQVEGAYLRAIAAFAADTGIERLAVREPQLPAPCLNFGLEPPMDGFGLDGVLPTGPDGFHDGAEVSVDTALDLVRVMLRDGGAWCRLEVEDTFAVHVGWDQYMYIGSSRPCETAVVKARALGLFPERIEASPYDFEPEDEGPQRPADDEFWDHLRWSMQWGNSRVLEEQYAHNSARWHRLTPDTIDTVRAGLTPRARLGVWPDLSCDIDAVLATLPAEGHVECVWQDREGRMHSVGADEDELPELSARLCDASAAMILPMYADDRVPLLAAVMPDSDGVVRARWEIDSTPSTRKWALLKTLQRGGIVTGRVTRIADFWVTFVDIGGVEAMINIPELSWRPFNHPSEVVAAGQEISAEILDVDPIRERVSLSLKTLHEDPMPLLTGLIGQTVLGRVTKLVPFGVFVRIEEKENGFVGLVHNTELGYGHPDHPRLGVQVGDALPVKILDIDPARRRITLSHRQAISPGQDEPGA